MGLEHVVLCPGSRSGPLALAVGGLSKLGRLRLHTSLDERSAAFLALGISTSCGKAAAIITTSGSAVANLLPAAVEADRSTKPLLFITADRPQRLKNCGANQSVNQEDFLLPACRYFCEGPSKGLHFADLDQVNNIAKRLWDHAHRIPGPVHLNLPLEEPLHPSAKDQELIWFDFERSVSDSLIDRNLAHLSRYQENDKVQFPDLDHGKPGVIVIGPWRGNEAQLEEFKRVIYSWQNLSKWPIFADPLSGLSDKNLSIIYNWDILLQLNPQLFESDLQVLRLGPLPASKSLENWLVKIGKKQLLITEGESRSLDPLKLSEQFSKGFVEWWNLRSSNQLTNYVSNSIEDDSTFISLFKHDELINGLLDYLLPLQGEINEPGLARWLPRLLPDDIPVMLSASSPVRDFMTYSGEGNMSRRFFGFRGASGIDGTLSLAMGLSISLGKLALVTGDLALLYDTNGWLMSDLVNTPLLVILIDNGGGGIFNRLGLEPSTKFDIDQLFLMPQNVDQLSLVEAYGIPTRQISSFEDLEIAIEWGLSKQGPVLLRVCTNSSRDMILRNKIYNDLVRHIELNS